LDIAAIRNGAFSGFAEVLFCYWIFAMINNKLFLQSKLLKLVQSTTKSIMWLLSELPSVNVLKAQVFMKLFNTVKIEW